MIFMGHRISYVVSDSNISFSVSFRIYFFTPLFSPFDRTVLGLMKIDGRTRGCGNNIFHFTFWTLLWVTNGFECERRPQATTKCAMHPFAIYFPLFCFVFAPFFLSLEWDRRSGGYGTCVRTSIDCVSPKSNRFTVESEESEATKFN